MNIPIKAINNGIEQRPLLSLSGKKRRKIKQTTLCLVLLTSTFSISSCVTGGMPITYEPIEPEVWPTQTWQSSTPEEQGMDSEKLIEMVGYYEEQRAENDKILFDSITIVRNGYVVADFYFNPLFPKDTPHIIHSCTKSIMSALIGIAIEEGYIDGVEVPVLVILNDKGVENVDERMMALTIKDLLSMQTGIRSEDSYLYGYRRLFEMQQTDDWVEYILNLPMDLEPGIRFDYSNMSSFLLSAIITKSTGVNTLSFARQHLFDPLGIEDIQWETSPQGIGIGWARMWLKPHDMAKFGMLYLQRGKWENQQIIPAQWVVESTTAHSFPKKYRKVLDENGEKDSKKTAENFVVQRFIRPFADGYGYQWWLDKSGTYSAIGSGGQYIMVVPHENLIVVFTSKLSGLENFLPAKMLDKYILPAIVSDESVMPNEAAQSELAVISEPPDLVVEAQVVPSLPELVQEISGKTYQLDANPWRYDNFQLVFDPSKDYAEFNYTAKEGEVINMMVGLDNVHRLAETNGKTYAAVGYWSSLATFSIDYEVIGYSTQDTWILAFERDEIIVEERGVTGVHTYRGKRQ